MKKSLLTLLLSSLFLSGSALAQSTTPASHLDRIKETKILVAGYREQSIPFSYLNNGKPTGFGVELTERVAEAIRKKFNAPDVRIRWNAVTLSTRYPLMTTKTLDINCATDIHTKASEELVGFSNTFYITRTSMVVAKDLNVKTLADLQGKRLAVPAGSTIEAKLRSAITEKKLEHDHRTCAQQLGGDARSVCRQSGCPWQRSLATYLRAISPSRCGQI